MMLRKLTVRIPAPLHARITAVASAEFETPESLAALRLARAFPAPRLSPPRYLRRDGGKASARNLLRPLKAKTKRARMVRWFMRAPSPTVANAASAFQCSREAIFAHLCAMHREHGIGYVFDGARDRITMKLPRGAKGDLPMAGAG